MYCSYSIKKESKETSFKALIVFSCENQRIAEQQIIVQHPNKGS